MSFLLTFYVLITVVIWKSNNFYICMGETKTNSDLGIPHLKVCKIWGHMQ